MTTYDLPARRARYFALSSQLAQLDQTQLQERFAASTTSQGWGQNHTLTIGTSKVFVKRLPLTDREYDDMFATRNLYELPAYYHYGVGSAGFGVFRELVAHIKTTNWVLAGEIENFPLLYHYRILPCAEERPAVDMERHKHYVDYWNGNQQIGSYMLARAQARHELALFLEHLPYAVEPWLLERPRRIGQALRDLRKAATFLRRHGIIHFDANFDNVLSDGKRTYLTDFGLVLDKGFALAEDEAALFKQSSYYDYGEILVSVGFLLVAMYKSLTDEDRGKLLEAHGMAEGTRLDKLIVALLKDIEKVRVQGILKLDRTYVATIIRYRSIIMLILGFFVDMRENKQKNTPFPHAKLKRLLTESGFLDEDGL